ncbi:hypothetical protein BJV82DRAFT_713944 [Fennellomyces sp. T-0311]|nr:hypothetical protein BJV82DRAFT_713944 [Fennellomyces sp. T-0311]
MATTEDDTVYHSYSPQIPTSAAGPTTIIIIVVLVLVTCFILNCSRVRETLNNRKISQRCRKLQEQQQYFHASDSPSFGSWSSSTSTVQGDAQQNTKHDDPGNQDHTTINVQEPPVAVTRSSQ